MSICTKNLGKILAFALCNLAFCFSAHAQANFMLMNSTVPAQWTPVALGTAPGNTNVVIMTGDTISLDILGHASKLTIQKWAILNSTTNASSGNLNSLEAGGGTASNPDTLENDGVFGSTTGTNDGIALAIPTTCSNLVLTGTGVTSIGAIRPAGYNAALTFELAQNASVNNKGVAFSATPIVDSNATADNITFNIDTGKTLIIANTGGKLQGVSVDGIGGNYTYNVKGTLDLSATADTSAIEPFAASAGSVITTNISGKLKLGSGFDGAGSATNSPNAASGSGKVAFDILAGGLVDATNTTYLNMGTNFFETDGTGVLKRKVDNLGQIFPVGAAGSSTYNPVTLNNKGTVTNFSVSVQNTASNDLLPNPSKVVNKQWMITPDDAGSDVTVEPAWLFGDQSQGFNPAQSIAVLNYNGTSWVETSAKLSGQGTDANPYIAAAPGYTTFGMFVVANSKINTEGPAALKVYPNPANDVINAAFPVISSNGSISISTSNGEKMLSSGVSNGSAYWNANISSWAPGVYIITLDNGGKKSSLKFIKL
jgi:hypothetical protein